MNGPPGQQVIDLQARLESMRGMISFTFEKWFKENVDTGKVQRKVENLLDQHRDQAIWALLGIEKSFNELRVRTTNADHSSIIMRFLDDRLLQGVNLWVRENFEKIPMVPQNTLKDAEKEYNRRFSWKLHDALGKAADRNAEAFVDAYIRQAFGSKPLEDIKAMNEMLAHITEGARQ